MPKKKRRGRPRTGHLYLGLRVAPQINTAILRWAKANNIASRSEAVRALIEHGLAVAQPPRRRSEKAASMARELANREIDRLSDTTLPADEQERRKRRLTKGPKELRDVPADRNQH